MFECRYNCCFERTAAEVYGIRFTSASLKRRSAVHNWCVSPRKGRFYGETLHADCVSPRYWPFRGETPFSKQHQVCASLQAELAHTWCNARLPYMLGMVLYLTTILSNRYRSGDFCPKLYRVVSEVLENDGFMWPLGRLLAISGPSGVGNYRDTSKELYLGIPVYCSHFLISLESRNHKL